MNFNFREVALGFIGLFLCIMLVNSLEVQSSPLTLGYFPTVTKEREPLDVTVQVRNTAAEPQRYLVRMFMDGVKIFSSESEIDSLSSQSFTYTRASPKMGSAFRFYAEALNLETGVKHSDVILVPPSPPEVWLSFAAFSSFATSLTSTSSMSSSLTIAYYQSMMGLMSTQFPLSPVNVGLTLSICLIGILVFLELADPSYSGVGRRVRQLRSRYGFLAAILLLIFVGIVLTRIVMVIA